MFQNNNWRNWELKTTRLNKRRERHEQEKNPGSSTWDSFLYLGEWNWRIVLLQCSCSSFVLRSEPFTMSTPVQQIDEFTYKSCVNLLNYQQLSKLIESFCSYKKDCFNLPGCEEFHEHDILSFRVRREILIRQFDNIWRKNYWCK